MSRLLISFSGGRTSAYMTKRLLELADARGSRDGIVVLFANTGQEDERTLAYVDRCDREYGFGVVWLEAAVSPERGEGTSFRLVDFATASRSGEPFEATVQKFGISNKNYPHCNREMKIRPITAYVRSLGWKARTYDTAIGIRADEADRIQPDARKNRIIYPLIKWGIRKADVIAWGQRQPFDLMVPEHLGNCRTCWKKSLRKLMTVAADDPGAFEFMDRMEREHPFTGPGEKAEPRKFFRGGRSAQDILELSRGPFGRYVDENGIQGELDLGSGCGESCEPWADEEAA